MKRRRLSRSKRNVRRRLNRHPTWCRFPWRKLPECWRRWWRCQTKLTPEEVNEIVEAMRTPLLRRSRVIAIDRVETPILNFLARSRHG